ncbi:MAG TPA: hypothetical protein DIW77_18535 [Chromatiaceae bacterium]|nr:MAG: hypothetical protein N838_21695 [Thiohalocapsa sp. PB-PSB1]HCS91966.1 hypothetical protein [Chromatiaceae bacterium]
MGSGKAGKHAKAPPSAATRIWLGASGKGISRQRGLASFGHAGRCKCVVSRGKQPPASIGRHVLHRETANKHTSPNACWPAVASLRLSSKRRAVLNVGLCTLDVEPLGNPDLH